MIYIVSSLNGTFYHSAIDSLLYKVLSECQDGRLLPKQQEYGMGGIYYAVFYMYIQLGRILCAEIYIRYTHVGLIVPRKGRRRRRDDKRRR